MDFKERERLVRRITSAKLFTRIEWQQHSIPVLFRDPQNIELLEADFVYQTYYDENQGNFITLQESFAQLQEEGVWTIEKQIEVERLERDVKTLQSSLSKLRFFKDQSRAVLKMIERGKANMEVLLRDKFKYSTMTLEHFSEEVKKRFLIKKLAEFPNKEEMIINPSVLDVLSVCYYIENGISLGQIRELARSDPWRLYWILAKETGTPLFPNSAVEITDYQYLLVFWSKIYDMAYESQNRPSDEVINNDSQFDLWYDQEAVRNKAERDQQSNQIDLKGNAGFGTSEVFIPTDREGAKELYDMNTPNARQMINRRFNIVKEKGEAFDHNFPEVNLELKAAMNRLATKEIQSRSK